jgi:hypothetical protein
MNNTAPTITINTMSAWRYFERMLDSPFPAIWTWKVCLRYISRWLGFMFSGIVACMIGPASVLSLAWT